jgi:hypothetical protein
MEDGIVISFMLRRVVRALRLEKSELATAVCINWPASRTGNSSILRHERNLNLRDYSEHSHLVATVYAAIQRSKGTQLICAYLVDRDSRTVLPHGHKLERRKSSEAIEAKFQTAYKYKAQGCCGTAHRFYVKTENIGKNRQLASLSLRSLDDRVSVMKTVLFSPNLSSI